MKILYIGLDKSLNTDKEFHFFGQDIKNYW